MSYLLYQRSLLEECRRLPLLLAMACTLFTTGRTGLADWATLEDTKGILAYDYIEKDSGTANELVNFKTDWTSWSSAEVGVVVGGSGFGYTASYLSDDSSTWYLDTDNPIAAVNHPNWAAGASIDFYAKLNGADKDTKTSEILVIDVEKSDVSGIMTNDGSKHLVLQFYIDVGSSSGRALTRLWVENVGSLQETADIPNEGIKLYYESGSSFSFDGTESSTNLWGNYNSNSTANEQWGNDDLVNISIPSDGNKLYCYIVIESLDSDPDYGDTAQFMIIDNGISLDNFGTFGKKAVRIDPMTNSTAMALGADPTLSVGGIMFVGYDGDPDTSDDNYVFAAMEDIPANTVVYFSDDQWDGSSFAGGEGWQEWDSGASVISAGTIIQVFDCSTGGRTVSHGALTAGQTMSLTLSDEGIWAYQGGPGVPTRFLSYIANQDEAGTGNSLNNTDLATANAAILFTGDEDVMEYTGARTGQATAADYRVLIANTASWTTGNGSGDQSVTFDTTAFVFTAPPAAPNATAATGISINGFTANWDTVGDADDYRLDIATSSIFGEALDDDFEDSDISGWTESTASRWEATASTPISGGASLHHAYDNASDDHDQASYTLSGLDVTAATTTWRFQVKHGYDPSTGNNWGAFLLSDLAAAEMYPSGGADGYVLGVNYTGSDDNLKLWKITAGAATELLDTGLDWQTTITDSGTAGIEVQRTAVGSWSVKVDTDGGFDNLVAQGGSLVNTDYTTASHFGIYYEYSSTQDQKLWVDDISITQPADFLTGFEDRTVTGTSTNVLGLDSATTYYYRLRAVNVGGTSGSSSTITVLTIPAATTALAATNVQDTSFYANWQPVDGEVSSYELDVASDSGFTSIMASYDDLDVGAVTTKLVTTDISAVSDYYYRVRAKNATGSSANSGTITVNTLAAEPASNPSSGVSLSNPTITSFDIDLSGANGDGTYTIVVCSTNAYATMTDPVDGTTYTGSADFSAAPVLGNGRVIYVGAANPAAFTLSNLDTGYTYYLRVYNFNGSGGRENYQQTDPEERSKATRPPAPTGVSASDNNSDAIVVSWSAASGATKYIVYRNTSNTTTGVTELDDNVTTLSYTDSSVPRNITYYYFLKSAAGTTYSEDFSAGDSGVRVNAPSIFLFK
ncbi:MAG: fibronectin type III domain-containing protein [Verrucomicrobia bacterium]|nr:fibronectin type III domain-containing protein [Verrucomicrobiota bacterium]